MVEIKIVIEGGVLQNDNINAATINNSEKLREAFYKLLSKVLNPEKFNLVIEIGAGYKNAAKSFRKYALVDHKTSLLIDLDGSKSMKQQRLNELEIAEYTDRVFFMVQEMEAWILSQPEAFLKCCSEKYIREKPDLTIETAEQNIFQENPEEISHPAEKLKVILARYFSEMKGNDKKKKKYGKLKDAPYLLESLDILKLIETFNDVKALKEHIDKQTPPN